MDGRKGTEKCFNILDTMLLFSVGQSHLGLSSWCPSINACKVIDPGGHFLGCQRQRGERRLPTALRRRPGEPGGPQENGHLYFGDYEGLRSLAAGAKYHLRTWLCRPEREGSSANGQPGTPCGPGLFPLSVVPGSPQTDFRCASDYAL